MFLDYFKKKIFRGFWGRHFSQIPLVSFVDFFYQISINLRALHLRQSA